ncbi:MAG TPA: helix-turn-helix domain-containing protein [Dehalococcoidia bacterium]|nr:helix-turn-helix domain-containing protein [Dehalococcoidia bacterium]
MTVNPRRHGQGPRRRTRRGPLTRKHILDVSLRLFSERGFARTSIRDIARDAGITDAAIYYHFSSKRELLEALVEERGFGVRLQKLEEWEPDVPLREGLLGMAAGAIAFMDENRDFLRLILMEGLAGDDVTNEQYCKLLERWERALVGVLERYKARGELGDYDPELLARHTIYLILGAFVDSLMAREDTSAPPAERREELSRLVTRALSRLPLG